MSELKQHILKVAERVVQIVEIILALGLIISVVGGMMLGGRKLWETAAVWSGPSFQNLIDQSLLYIIGLEIAVMLLKRNPSIVLDILIFAVARKLIVETSGGLDFFLGALAIFVLYFVRHFDFKRLTWIQGQGHNQHFSPESPTSDDTPADNPAFGALLKSTTEQTDGMQDGF